MINTEKPTYKDKDDFETVITNSKINYDAIRNALKDNKYEGLSFSIVPAGLRILLYDKNHIYLEKIVKD